MLKAKRRVNALLWVVVGIVLLVGITFASIFSTNKTVSVPVYPTAIGTSIDMKTDLSNVVDGDTVITKASFNTTTTTNNVYVRADIRYYVDTTTMSNNDRVFLIRMNYSDISTSTGTSYKWVRGTDGYYYLTNTSGIPLQVSSSNATTEYILCEDVKYSSAKNYVSGNIAPDNLKLKVEMQVINAKNMDTTSNLTTIASKFKECFGNNDTLGYIVTFNANGATNPPAQVFLDNNSTVTCPETPSKVGYIFEGWYTDSSYNTEYTFTNTVTNSFTLYAKFVEGKKVTITKGDNIESVTVTTNGETIKSGDLVPVGATLTISVTATSGYTASWTVTNGTTTESANATSVTIAGDIVITVTSSELASYTISWGDEVGECTDCIVTVTNGAGDNVANGGKIVDGDIITIEVDRSNCDGEMGYIQGHISGDSVTETYEDKVTVTVKGNINMYVGHGAPSRHNPLY